MKLMDIGRAVQVMRTIRGLTQAELAAAAGVNRVVIWQIESGQMLPGPEVEVAIKRALRWPAEAEVAFAILEGGEAAA